MALRPLFVTQIYEASLAGERDFAAFNDELEDACRMLADEDMAGRAWCKEHRYGGYTSYASLDDLPMRASICAIEVPTCRSPGRRSLVKEKPTLKPLG